jgi:hypothetical protein
VKTSSLEGLEAWRLEGLRRAFLRLLACLLTWIGTTAPLLACPICFRVEEGPVTAGVRAAVVVLVSVTVGVLAGFGRFIARFVARARSAKCR